MTGARLKRVADHLDCDDFMLTYGDGLSDVDIPASSTSTAPTAALATVTGVRPPGRFGELQTDGPAVRRFSEKPVETGRINGGFFAFKRGFLDYVRDDDACILERDPLERAAADGQLQMFAHDGYLAVHGHLPRPPQARRGVERRRRPVEELVTMAFWTDRPVFVTGATGLLGSHMTQELLARGANPVCLVRDQVAHSHFQRLGLDRRRDRPRLPRGLRPARARLNEHEIDTVMHLGAQTIVGTASRNPLSTWESNVRGSYLLLEACRRNAKNPPRRRRLERQGLRRPAEPPLHRGRPARSAASPTTAPRAAPT
jgi:hypothetical protein